jgi:hypothetical protein
MVATESGGIQTRSLARGVLSKSTTIASELATDLGDAYISSIKDSCSEDEKLDENEALLATDEREEEEKDVTPEADSESKQGEVAKRAPS